MSNNGLNKSTKATLARPWILPFVIVTGLAAAWAAPWTFADGTPVSFIFKTLVPLLIQAIISSVCAILAFLGKPSWLPLLIWVLKACPKERNHNDQPKPAFSKR